MHLVLEFELWSVLSCLLGTREFTEIPVSSIKFSVPISYRTFLRFTDSGMIIRCTNVFLRSLTRCISIDFIVSSLDYTFS